MASPTTTADKHSPNFDTGAMRDRLTESGTTEQVAAGIVDVVVDSQSELSTKADIKEVKAYIQTENTKLKLWVSLHTIGMLLAFLADRLFN